LVFLVFKNRCENWAGVGVHETADGRGPRGTVSVKLYFNQPKKCSKTSDEKVLLSISFIFHKNLAFVVG